MKKLSFLLVGVLALLLVGNSLALAESKNLETMPESTSGSSFLEDEAGITAYTKVDSMNLSEAKKAFKNIEREADDYLVGSVSIADHREGSDAHVYVDQSGWIAAYYVKKRPATNIIDWRHYDPTTGASTTNLERAIKSITEAMSIYVEVPYFKYCDFRYPEADKILIATDEVVERGGTETFKIKIPSDFTVYSQSWSHYGRGADSSYGCHHVKFSINGTITNEKCTENYADNWKIWEGYIEKSQLPLGIYHEISVTSPNYDYSSYVGLAIIYSR